MTDLTSFGVQVDDDDDDHDREALAAVFGVDEVSIEPHDTWDDVVVISAPHREISVDKPGYIANHVADLGYETLGGGENSDREWFVNARLQEEEPDDGPPARSYPRGRCPAIANSHRNRCKAPVSRMNAADGFCGVHGRERDPWTIHDDPEKLILVTGRLDALSLEDLDEDDVGFDLGLIQDALAAVQEEST